MKGTVKWFDAKKGYGFITGGDGKDYFVHHSKILMGGFRKLDTDDIIEFEVGTTETDIREQAINVQPVLTLAMIEKALQEEDLHVNRSSNNYVVVNKDNVIQTREQGMTLVEVAAFAGIDVEGLE